MDRRGFLRTLGIGTAAVAVSPVIEKIKPENSSSSYSLPANEEKVFTSFGMDPVKRDGESFAYDIEADTVEGNFKPLWPGVKDWWEQQYNNIEKEIK